MHPRTATVRGYARRPPLGCVARDPGDEDAQASMQRPIARIGLRRIVSATEDYSGADLAHLRETAAEHAMADRSAPARYA